MTTPPTAPVTQIIRGSTVDGPGLRTVVFFKGCPLRCPWCHNPETQSVDPEVLFDERFCIGCHACAGVCDFGAIDVSRNHIIDHEACTGCFACCEVCPSNALTPAGKRYAPDELMKELLKDRVYYQTSGGGCTFSGGEPLLHPDFLQRTLHLCRDHEISTCIDTCLAVEQSSLDAVIPLTDLFLVDIKHTSRPEVAPDRVFSNLHHLCGKSRLWLRIPVIPEWNDSPEEITTIINRCLPLRKAVERVELLPFHHSASRKYRSLNRDWSLYETMKPVPEDRIREYSELFRENGFTVI